MRLQRERADRRQRVIITVSVVVVVALLIGLAWWAISSTVKKTEIPFTAPSSATEDFGFVVTPEDVGAKSAENAVDIVVYEDMQCPACQSFFLSSAEFLDAQLAEGTISLEYRVISFLDRTSTNRYSSRAGNAVICSYENGGPALFKAFSGDLFVNQSPEGGAGHEDDALVDFAQQAAARVEVEASAALEECITGHTYIPWLEDSTSAFNEAGYSGTPTILVGGEKVEGEDGGLPLTDDLEKAIKDAQGK